MPPGTYIIYDQERNPRSATELVLKGPDANGAVTAKVGEVTMKMSVKGRQLAGTGETSEGKELSVSVGRNILAIAEDGVARSIIRPVKIGKVSALNALMASKYGYQVDNNTRREALKELLGEEPSRQDHRLYDKLLSYLLAEHDSSAKLKKDFKEWVPLSDAQRAGLSAGASGAEFESVLKIRDLADMLVRTTGGTLDVGGSNEGPTLDRLQQLEQKLAITGGPSIESLAKDAAKRFGDQDLVLDAIEIIDALLLRDVRLDDAENHPVGSDSQSFRDYLVDTFLQLADAGQCTATAATWLAAEMALFESVGRHSNDLARGKWYVSGTRADRNEAAQVEFSLKEKGEAFELSLTFEGKTYKGTLECEGNDVYSGHAELANCNDGYGISVSLEAAELLNGRNARIYLDLEGGAFEFTGTMYQER
jgi:hypothetical protein